MSGLLALRKSAAARYRQADWPARLVAPVVSEPPRGRCDVVGGDQ